MFGPYCGWLVRGSNGPATPRPSVAVSIARMRRTAGPTQKALQCRTTTLMQRAASANPCTRYEIRQVHRRRHGRNSPPRRGECGNRLEHGTTRYRDEAACEHELSHARDRQQRDVLIAAAGHRRDRKPENRCRRGRRRHVDEQLQQGTAEHRGSRRRALSDPWRRHHEYEKRRLDHRDGAEHHDLGQQVRRR